MAAAVPLDELEEELATCHVCEEPFDADSQVPLTLTPCRHVFCRACVTKLAGTGPFPCPVCRTDVDLGRDGVEGLSKDRVTMNVVDYISMKKKMQTTGINCTDCPDGAKALFRCHTCRTHLCNKCQEAHARTTVTRTHDTVQLSTYMESMENFVKEKESCLKHPDKDIELYCKSCSLSLCALCGMVEHRSHAIVYFDEVHNEAICENKSLRDELSQKALRISNLKKTQNEIIESIAMSIDEIKQDIQNQFTTTKSLLDKRQDELTKKCDDMRKEIEGYAEMALNRLADQDEQLEGRKLALKKTQEMTRPTQLVSMQKELSEQVRTLVSLKDPQLYQPRAIHFQPVGFEAVNSAIKAMGTVARIGEAPARYSPQVDIEQLLHLRIAQAAQSDFEEQPIWDYQEESDADSE